MNQPSNIKIIFEMPSMGGKGSLQLKVSLRLKMLLEVKVTTEITECFNEVILVCIKIIAQ
jgi:hypothetical protein